MVISDKRYVQCHKLTGLFVCKISNKAIMASGLEWGPKLFRNHIDIYKFHTNNIEKGGSIT